MYEFRRIRMKLRTLGRAITEATGWVATYQCYEIAPNQKGIILEVKNDHGKTYRFYVDMDNGKIQMEFLDTPLGHQTLEIPDTIDEIVWIMNNEQFHDVPDA